MFEFHPGAREALSRRAGRLLESLENIRPDELGLSRDSFRPDILVASELTEAQILDPVDMEYTKPAIGEVSMIVLDTGKGLKALRGPACAQLDELVNEAAKPAAVSTSVGRPFLRSTIKAWLRAYLNSNTADDIGSYIEKAIRAAVREFTVWVPISSLYLESDFQLGNVLFCTLRREKLDEWLERFKSGTPEPEIQNLELRFYHERLRLQGLAAAVITIVAEQDFGLMQALEKADEATALLRIFHLSNLSPRVCSYCRPLGLEHTQRFQAYLEPSRGGLIMQSGILESDSGPWKISETELARFRKNGLNGLHRLLSEISSTDFQKRLRAALIIYSQNSLAKKPIEKLVFILVALESLLLKDERESIQQNIGERLAFATTKKPDERRRIVDLTHACYNYRSRFLHHGHDEHQIELMSEFMKHVWIFLVRLIGFQDKYTTKDDMIQSIEAIKFA